MSLADEARELRERVLGRLAELEPLLAEHAELTTLAREMGWVTEEGRSAAPAAPVAPAPAAPAAPAASARGRSGAGRRSAAAKPEPGAAGGGGGAAKAPRARGRARRGAGGGPSDKRILAGVAATPGTTVAELAAELGVAAQALFAPVQALTDAGRLVKRGRQLFPPDA